jgi:hypothetical protein
MTIVNISEQPGSGLAVELTMKGDIPEGYVASVTVGWVDFSTCCDSVHTTNEIQIRALRDALSAWLDREGLA